MKHPFRTCCIFLCAICFLATSAMADTPRSSSTGTYTLQDLLSALSANNPDIRTARQEYERALLDVKDAKASRGPSVDLQITGTYMAKPLVDPIIINTDALMDAIQWPTGMKPQSTGQYITLYDGMEQTMYQIQATLLQPVFTWGKLSAAEKLYSQVADIRQSNVEFTRDQLETELETRIASLKHLFAMESILREESEYAAQLVRYSEDGERSGMILHQDVVDARIQAKQLDIAIQTLNEQIENQILELQRQTGLYDLLSTTIAFDVDDEAVVAEVLSADRIQYQDKALSESNPSINMVSRLKEVSELATDIAENSVYWKPDFAVQIAAGYSGSRIPLVEPNWLLKDDYSLNLTIAMKTTIWDGGKKLNDTARRISEEESAGTNLDSARATIRQTLANQWNTADMSTIKIEYQDLKIEAAESKISQQEMLFRSGAGTEADLLAAKIELCNQKIEKEQQLLSRAVACYTIRFLCR